MKSFRCVSPRRSKDTNLMHFIKLVLYFMYWFKKWWILYNILVPSVCMSVCLSEYCSLISHKLKFPNQGPCTLPNPIQHWRYTVGISKLPLVVLKIRGNSILTDIHTYKRNQIIILKTDPTLNRLEPSVTCVSPLLTRNKGQAQIWQCICACPQAGSSETSDHAWRPQYGLSETFKEIFTDQLRQKRSKNINNA